MPYKQAIVVRTDIHMSKGKLAAQVAHGSVAAINSSPKEKLKGWMQEGMKKIVLKVKSLEELRALEQKAREAKIAAEMITDAGHTFLEPGTVTCLGIGPDEEEKIDTITGKLKIL